jgi:hypothetical protein
LDDSLWLEQVLDVELDEPLLPLSEEPQPDANAKRLLETKRTVTTRRHDERESMRTPRMREGTRGQ